MMSARVTLGQKIMVRTKASGHRMRRSDDCASRPREPHASSLRTAPSTARTSSRRRRSGTCGTGAALEIPTRRRQSADDHSRAPAARSRGRRRVAQVDSCTCRVSPVGLLVYCSADGRCRGVTATGSGRGQPEVSAGRARIGELEHSRVLALKPVSVARHRCEERAVPDLSASCGASAISPRPTAPPSRMASRARQPMLHALRACEVSCRAVLVRHRSRLAYPRLSTHVCGFGLSVRADRRFVHSRIEWVRQYVAMRLAVQASSAKP